MIHLVWIIVFSICLFLIPHYLSFKVGRQPAFEDSPRLYNKNSTKTVYWIVSALSKHFEKDSTILLVVCFKILPILILIIFSVLLILNIHHARHLREIFNRRHSSMSSSISSLKRELRITTMLVIIMLYIGLIQLSQVFPHIINNDLFVLNVHLIDIWDIPKIGSSFLTFIIYSVMSQQFRMEMYNFILHMCFRKKFNLKTNNHLLADEIS